MTKPKRNVVSIARKSANMAWGFFCSVLLMLIILTLAALLLGCGRGPSGAPGPKGETGFPGQDVKTESCTAQEMPSGDVIVSCPDGSAALIEARCKKGKKK